MVALSEFTQFLAPSRFDQRGIVVPRAIGVGAVLLRCDRAGEEGVGEVVLRIPPDMGTMICAHVEGAFETYAMSVGGRHYREPCATGTFNLGFSGEPIRMVVRSAHADVIQFYFAESAMKAYLAEAGVEAGQVELIDPRNKKDRKMTAIARGVAAAMREDTAVTRMEVEALGLSALAHLLRAHSNLAGSGLLAARPLGGLTARQLRRALERMGDDLLVEPDLAELAKLVGLSPKHFARAFRQSTGIAPHQWLIDFRISRARSLLTNSTNSLAHVATTCGFADQSHFTAVFTKRVGVTPGRYRRERLA